MTRILKGLIRLYQRFVSPLLGDRCRFYPSCSQYALEALKVHGLVRGCALATWRLLRCQPLCKGGYDPVPPARRARKNADRSDAGCAV
ncbi:MAG TPA: membrane protein insertion efficiency factor YidD [Candidatus Hydrogenedentes bacterium]|nr:membrane protein insertion efficiency factor YidD [Candidatus Hydrogenedentota bacterium]